MTQSKKTEKIKQGVKMSDQNSFHFIGRLTRPAELKYIGQNNTACATFSLAVKRWNKSKNQDDVYYFDFSYYGQSADNVLKYLEKGKQISVKGFHKQDRWEKDGEKHSRVSFVVTELQLLGGGKKEDGGGMESSHVQTPAAPSNNLPAAPDFTGGEMDGIPDEIPF